MECFKLTNEGVITCLLKEQRALPRVYRTDH